MNRMPWSMCMCLCLFFKLEFLLQFVVLVPVLLRQLICKNPGKHAVPLI